MSEQENIEKLYTVFEKVDRTYSIFFGFLVFFMGCLIVIISEVQTIDRSTMLSQGAGQVISIKANEPIDPANNGKLVHITGLAMSNNTLHDVMFGVQASGIMLWRNVQMYQWQKKKDTSNNFSDSDNRYYYVKTWDTKAISTADTKYANPPMPFLTQTYTADDVYLGEFTLAFDLIYQIQNSHTIPLENVTIPSKFQGKMRNQGTMLYMGNSSSTSGIGDVKVTFHVTDPTMVSIIAEQNGTLLKPFQIASNDLFVVTSGTHSVDEMFQSEVQSNSFNKLFSRIVGFILMLVTAMIWKPQLINIARRIPGLSNFVTTDSPYTTMILGTVLFIIVFLVGWIIAYVPFIGYIIMGLFALGYLALVKKLGRSKSLLGKIFFILMTLIILIIVIAIVTFIYLTRAG